jgi:hypothetical protein
VLGGKTEDSEKTMNDFNRQFEMDIGANHNSPDNMAMRLTASNPGIPLVDES